MIQTTQTWKDYSVDHSNYHPLIVVIKNGNIIWTFDATNIKEGSLKFTDDITDLGDFNIGATPSNTFECDIINFDNTFPSPDTFRGCKANLYFFLERPEFGGTNAVVGQAIVGQAIVGTESTWTNYIKRGVYYLDPVNSVGRTVHLSGSDAMSLPEFNSANMSGFSFGGLTCYQAIKKMGFNLQHTFPNSDYVLPNVVCNEESNLANITKRTALGYIASLCGCYARHDNTGELRLSRFVLDTPTTVTKIMQEPVIDYYPVTVTGVFVSGTEGSYSVKGSDGYYLFVENNPLITSPSIADEVATAINTAYNGLSIYPFSLSYIADPSLEAGDTIDITYNGNTTTTIVGSFQYSLGNQSSLSIDADTEEHSSAEALIASIPGTKLAIQDLYKGDVLKKIINLSADEVQIDADNLNINGVVSANNNFKVNLDGTVEAVNGVFSGTVNASSGTFSGSITASSGTIGGFQIETNSIHTADVAITSNASGSVGLSSSTFTRTIGGTSRSSLKFAIGSNFGVSQTGVIYANSLNASNATLTGTVKSAAGIIGGWNLHDGYMDYTMSGTHIYLYGGTYVDGTSVTGLFESQSTEYWSADDYTPIMAFSTNGRLTLDGDIIARDIYLYGSVKEPYTDHTFTVTNGISAGTIGSRATQLSWNTGKTVKYVTVTSVTSSTSYNPSIVVVGNTVYINYYRAVSTAVTQANTAVKVRAYFY